MRPLADERDFNILVFVGANGKTTITGTCERDQIIGLVEQGKIMILENE